MARSHEEWNPEEALEKYYDPHNDNPLSWAERRLVERTKAQFKDRRKKDDDSQSSPSG